MPDQLGLPFRSATDLAVAVRRRQIGARELLDLYWSRVERFNPDLNAIIVHDIEAACERADEADAALARGDRVGPLYGVPMTVKESFDLTGTPTTWGIPANAKAVARENAETVQRLIDAGANIFGKTNVPLYLADWQTFNEIYGTTNNPWDPGRTPGGSSGGAASALASGMTGLELGSDIGASIRNPAHYCGVYGHKPTYGLVSYRGHALPGVVAAPDIAVAGPLARSARDLDLGLSILAGPGPIERRGLTASLAPPRHTRLRGFRVAVMASDPVAEADQSVQDAIARLADFLSERGAHVNDTARPAFDAARAHEVYIALLRAATSRRQTDAEYEANIASVPALAPDDDGYEARMLRAYVMSHREWLGWNEERHRMRLMWEAFFEDYDVLLCPAATTTAFPHNQKGERWERMVKVNGRDQPGTDQMFWAGYSCCFYLPGTVAPIGFCDRGLPIGVQIVGPQFGDRTTIELAKLIEREYHAFTPPPGYV